MAKRTKRRRTSKPLRAELVAKWPEIVAQLKAELREESPESAREVLAAMLKQARRRLKLPANSSKAPGEAQKQVMVKRDALRRFSAIFRSYAEPLKQRERRAERLNHGQWSPNASDARAMAFLDGVHCAFMLFDILVFTERGGLKDGEFVSSLFGRQLGASEGGQTRAENHPGQLSEQQEKWQAIADKLCSRNANLTDAELYRQVAEAIGHPHPTTFARQTLRHLIKGCPNSPSRQRRRSS